MLLSVFFIVQTRVRTPLLSLKILTDRGRGAALIALLLSSAGLFTTFLFLPYFLQSSLGYKKIRTGLAFLPVPIALVASAAVIGPILTRRFRTRTVMPAGLATATAAATARLSDDLAGAAAATVNAAQQIGGSIGVAVLNTVAASAAAAYLTTDPAALADAAIHSYGTAFGWTAAIFLTGAILTALITPTKEPAQ